jgi:pheromone shutdown protein TraB
VKCFLKGDLEKLMSAIKEFPTLSEPIIGKRDSILCERMKTFFEKGNVIAFVGITHIQGIKKMLFEDGYKITPAGSNHSVNKLRCHVISTSGRNLNALNVKDFPLSSK